MSIDVNELRERLDYAPETGEFFWRSVSGSRTDLVGRRAGSVDQRGYRRITFDGKLYSAHRLAFLYMFGRWPNGDIDHANGNKGR